MFDGLGDAFCGAILAAVFLSVLAIALALAFALSWFGHNTAGLWAAGVGLVLAYIAARIVRRGF